MWGFIIAAFVLLSLGKSVGSGYLNLLWFRSLGYAIVFWRTLTGELIVGVVGGALCGAFFLVNLLVALPALRHVDFGGLPIRAAAWLRPRALVGVAALVSLAVGVLAGVSLAPDWLVVWRFLDGQPFPTVDPIFHHNVAFFVFNMPFYELAYQLTGLFLVLALLTSGAIYFGTGLVVYFDGHLQVHPRARAHLATLLGIYLALKSFGYVLGAWNLEYSPRGVVFGASYADVHAQLPAQHIMTVLAALVAVIAFANARLSLTRWLVTGILGMMGAWMLLVVGWPALVETFVVKPSEITAEAPYIQDNISMTRAAFDLTNVKEQAYPVRQDLSQSKLQRDAATVQNVRLWDWRVASAAFEQLQSLRTYYRFDPMTVGRYTINGQKHQVLISAREIAYSRLPEQTWVNETVKYTHGYGAVVVPASLIGASGLPNFWVQGIPPQGTNGFSIRQPDIYYGEQTNNYVLVDTTQPEFDYPAGQQNRYTRYSGTGGVPMGPGLNRLALSFWAGNYNILFSSYITSQTRALLHRSIRARVAQIAPFLRFDANPYLVIAGGRLYWIIDAYTVTDRYPYSQPVANADLGTLNYIRNSVKVVVDAYNGTTRFYVADPTDPIIRTYERIFPGFFRPLAEMPSALRAHLRYPQDMFTAQVQTYAKYHMTDPVVFYNREDLWQQAQETTGTTTAVMPPYYVIVRLPTEAKAHYTLIQPMTPAGKDNMVAWLGGRWVQGKGGQLIAFAFPKSNLVFGPLQVDSRITQNPQIAQDMTLWSQQGSTVFRGNLIVIPIAGSLLNVEPLYQTAAATNLPELRLVIVTYGDQIGIGNSLNAALQQIFPTPGVTGKPQPAPSVSPVPAPVQVPVPTPSPTASLQQQALQLYQQAADALKAGQFATFGQRLQQLGKVLQRLNGQ